ncbi:MAG TPA: KpsF/GutQ family sugar-phosphate isomerase [Synergistales bacterium]|nr:KpsF/GutQ family sugar-phosphate isomerase [Synergistales bacterium]
MVSLPRERVNVDFDDEKLLEVGRRVLRMEAEEIVRAAARVGGELVEAARIIGRCKGRLVVVGMGKSGLVGRKIAATLASLGTPAFFLHAAEGSHGDLGMVCREDTGLFLSNSGQTREVLEVLPFFRRLGSPVIALTGNLTSRLARDSDVVINSGVEKEADPLGLAPTTSTTLQLALGDALAGMVTELRGLRPEDFALFHPGGSLGRRLLLRVSDVMATGERVPRVTLGASVREALFEITSKGFGATVIEDERGMTTGIFTDGDLRRLLEDRGADSLSLPIEEVMTRDPRTISPDRLAAEAMHIMEEREISCLVVCEEGKAMGIVHIHELLKAGVV